MKIAVAQINTIVGDLQDNYDKITQYIDKAKESKCDIIVFPELSLSGYPPEDLLLKKYFIAKQFEYVVRLICEVKDIVVILGYAETNGNKKPYNTSIAFYNHKIIARHYKTHLPNYSVFDEKRYFTPGSSSTFRFSKNIFEFKDKKIAINICEDIWIDDGIAKKQALENPDIMINISCSPYYGKKIHERETLLKNKAIEYNTNIVYCNLVGGQDELVFDGGSMIINKKGNIVARSYQFVEDLLIHKLGSINPLPCTYEKTEEIYRALKLGLRDYVTKNGFKQVVLGMSGGIDSALVAKLAVGALGKENVICISMPSMYTSDGTYSDAETYSKELGVEFIEFPITHLINSYDLCFDPFFENTKEGITEENIQARIRGNIIMGFSNKFGYMPLSTGNKSEVSVGYCTLYGDMAGGFNAIKDLYKTQVYELAEFVGVPESIINRPPSAELKKDQRDEDSLPPYEVLDEILKKLMERNEAPENELERKIAKMLRLSEYKRRQSCPGIKITKRSYGKDYRMPIVNGYHE